MGGTVFAENLETVGPLSFTNPGNSMEQGGKVGVGRIGRLRLMYV